MSKQTEALKLAQDLRALADRFSEGWHEGIKIDALDIELLANAAEALAEQPVIQQGWDVDDLLDKPKQPAQQKPVAFMNPDDLCADTAFRWCKIDEFAKPVYTSPPASKPWVGLTDDEIALICAECSLRTPCDIYYARAIEAKLREKNA